MPPRTQYAEFVKTNEKLDAGTFIICRNNTVQFPRCILKVALESRGSNPYAMDLWLLSSSPLESHPLGYLSSQMIIDIGRVEYRSIPVVDFYITIIVIAGRCIDNFVFLLIVISSSSPHEEIGRVGLWLFPFGLGFGLHSCFVEINRAR